MKLENDNNAGYTKFSTVPPGSSTSEDTAPQNSPKVASNDRAEPVSTNSANPKQKKEVEIKSSCNTSIPAKGYI